MNTSPGSTNARQRNATSIQENAVCVQRPTAYRIMRAAEKWQFSQTSTKTDVNQQCDIVRQRYNCRQIGGWTMRRNGELRRIVGSPRRLGGRRGTLRPRTAIVRFAHYARSSLRFILKRKARNERRGSRAPLRPPRPRGERQRDSFNGRPGREFRLQICLFSWSCFLPAFDCAAPIVIV